MNSSFKVFDYEKASPIRKYVSALLSKLKKTKNPPDSLTGNESIYCVDTGFFILELHFISRSLLQRLFDGLTILTEYLLKEGVALPPAPNEIMEELRIILLNWTEKVDVAEEMDNFFKLRDEMFLHLARVDKTEIVGQVKKLAGKNNREENLRLSIFLKAIAAGSPKKLKLLKFRLGKKISRKLDL